MILADVNVWVYAFRADSPWHKAAHSRLQELRETAQPFLFIPSVTSSFLRLVTNPKIFLQPSPLDEAWQFLTTLQDDPAAVIRDADEMAMGIFKHLSLVTNAAANSVPDAYLAALAVRHNAVLLTADRGFQRYQALQCEFLALS